MERSDIWSEPADPDLFRDAFRRVSSHIPAGVAVLACVDRHRKPTGLTVSSVTCVSVMPPLVAVCIARESAHVDHIERHRRFSLNVLRDDQAELAARFAAHGADKFQGVPSHVTELDVPVIDGTLATLCCEFVHAVAAGDHQLILGRANEVRLHAAGAPLVYWRRSFHVLDVRHPFLESGEALNGFLRDWESGTLPRTAWTHGAHVAVAACYAFEHPPEQAFQMMKSGIVHFNVCVATPNTEDSGYHETLTRFWTETVGRFVRDRRFGSRLEAAREAVRQFGEDRDRHRLYYSFDVVRDRTSRREWVPPDRRPAP